eukprot:1054421_1
MSHDSHIWVELQCHYKNCNSHQWRTNSIMCIQGKAISHWCHSRQRRMALYTNGNKLTVVRCSTAAYQLFPARIKLLVDQSVVMDDPIQNENANGNQESMIEEYSSHNTNRIQTDQTNDLMILKMHLIMTTQITTIKIVLLVHERKLQIIN